MTGISSKAYTTLHFVGVLAGGAGERRARGEEGGADMVGGTSNTGTTPFKHRVPPQQTDLLKPTLT